MKIGIANADITPALGVPCSEGLDDECERVLDAPHIRALMLDDDDTRICLLSADVIGMGQETHAVLRGVVSEATGIPEANVVAHATHSHEAPTVQIAQNRELEPYGLRFADPGYYQQFLEAAASAVRAAQAGLAPASAAWGMGKVQGVASNRRIVDESGQILMRYSNSTAELRAYPDGEIDPWVRVLRFAGAGGEALSLNYCCHPTAAGGDEERYATADFPGAAMRLLEAERPGRTCTYFTGPCGNVNPGKYTGDRGTPDDRIRDVQRLGARLAEGARLALADMAPVEWGSLRLVRRPVALPLREGMPTIAELEAMLVDAVATYRRAKVRGERLIGGGDIRRIVHRLVTLRLSRDGAIPTEVVAIAAGRLAFCFLPGECFLELAQGLWARFPDLRLQVVAPADYSVGYVAVPGAYSQGGYETSVALVGPDAFGMLLGAAADALATATGS
ncbi:MAG: neutral/alkaline non-lysosomal ceramidase N-terminal domain-containing protein [Anaerolineae bacterium]